ncbi:AAA family ATPase [Oceanobacillus sojae]|uniref:Magnesium chelatase n=1 Tax=Oceanobacillus sojae TaxID=582851 RepID=A0A511ZPF3_9BACI|nr:MoxR family ATPase [Oceanobacillus sojae]GEN89297.1 magnesium chelatase [Oceanobacillus sojae]
MEQEKVIENTQIQEVLNNVNSVIFGKEEIVKLSLVALLTEGHVLLEDVPGVGKTMLVRALAKSVNCDFTRIQFTPDLLPSDVTGVSIYNPKELEFEFRKGPVFGNILLADEINRTSPKTQSALLEAMEEKSVTVDGETRRLQSPFFVMATQNPIEYEGTYPLPEAQLDRFLLKLRMGYPAYEDELEMLARNTNHHPIEEIQAVMAQKELLVAQEEAKDVYMDETIQAYILNIVTRTRSHSSIYLGVSPRGSLALMEASKAYAYIEGRDYVIPDDVKYLAPFVLSHRIMLKAEARYKGTSNEALIDSIIQSAHIPIKKGIAE